MASFLDEIRKQQSGETQQEEREPRLVPDVVLGNRNPNLTLRILPSPDEQNPMGFLHKFRSIYIDTGAKSNGGKNIGAFWNLPDGNRNTKFDQQLNKWASEGKMEGKFGTSKPRGRALVNAMVLDRSFNPKVDANGMPEISVVELPYSVYSEILTKLNDDRIVTEATPEGFIGTHGAFPVEIAKNSENKYNVTVWMNQPLPDITTGREWVAAHTKKLADYTKNPEEVDRDYYERIVELMEAKGSAQEETGALEAADAQLQNMWQPTNQAQAQAAPAPQAEPTPGFQQPAAGTPFGSPVQPQKQAPAAQVNPFGSTASQADALTDMQVATVGTEADLSANLANIAGVTPTNDPFGGGQEIHITDDSLPF